MFPLESERLILRNFTSDDWKDLAELGIKYEQTELAIYDEGPWPEDVEEYKTIVLDMSKGNDFVAVVLKKSQKLIGLVFKTQRENGCYELGYNFNVDYHGKGYALESCKKVLDYLFQELSAEQVDAGTAKINKKSSKLLERLGFHFIREKQIAFRKDASGNPIEFEALDFTISNEDWNLINKLEGKRKKN